MIGDIHVDDDIEFEVVWAGGEGLVAPRDTRVTDSWTPPLRMYNKSGKYAKKDCECVKVDNKDEILDDINRLNGGNESPHKEAAEDDE